MELFLPEGYPMEPPKAGFQMVLVAEMNVNG
jgi:ubiquitin-protein ligase